MIIGTYLVYTVLVLWMYSKPTYQRSNKYNLRHILGVMWALATTALVASGIVMCLLSVI